MSDAGAPIQHSAVQAGAPWLRGDGPDSDVVISSRVRLARNLAGFAFLQRAKPVERQGVFAACRDHLTSVGLAKQVIWAEVHRLPQIDRTLLMERHLLSKEHSKGGAASGVDWPRGLCVSAPDERLSIMVNEEDHLRVQVLRSGLALTDAWQQIDAVDDLIEAGLEYAYSARFGYLTACPTNVGCALRMSVMLHLPGLRMTGELDRVRRATKELGLAVRGYYGENSDASGDFFQISNQVTLGKSEETIRRELEKQILPQVLEYERASRRLLLEKRRRATEDDIFRALGLLRSARLLAPEEAMAQLSLVRMGVLMGVVQGLTEQAVTQLFLLVQPSHLQRYLGKEMDQQRRREARADLVRERLGGI